MQASSSAAFAGVVLRGISSMATRGLLAALVPAFERQSACRVQVESVGGVDAARRVAAGEAFDWVMLASDAMGRLMTAGHLQAGSQVDVVRSPVAVAVRAGQPQPDIGTEAALKAAVLAARSISYSTGPSGVYLQSLFARWGIAQSVAARMVQAPPGVPVGSLVAQGEVELGFQQLSELMNLPGISVLGVLPPGCDFITTFSAAIGLRPRPGTAQHRAVSELLAYLGSTQTLQTKHQHGMDAA